MFFQQTFNPPPLKILYLFSPDFCKGLFITEILLICSDLARIISSSILLTRYFLKNKLNPIEGKNEWNPKTDWGKEMEGRNHLGYLLEKTQKDQ